MAKLFKIDDRKIEEEKQTKSLPTENCKRTIIRREKIRYVADDDHDDDDRNNVLFKLW